MSLFLLSLSSNLLTNNMNVVSICLPVIRSRGERGGSGSICNIKLRKVTYNSCAHFLSEPLVIRVDGTGEPGRRNGLNGVIDTTFPVCVSKKTVWYSDNDTERAKVVDMTVSYRHLWISTDE